MQDPLSYTQERERMIREQIVGRGVRDPRLLSALRSVPRHFFVPIEYRSRAYADGRRPRPGMGRRHRRSRASRGGPAAGIVV